MKESDKKYYIIYIKGNIETIIGEFVKEKDAQNEFEKIKQTNRKRTGAFQLLRAFMLPDGKLDLFKREPIAAYCPEVEAFLRKLKI